MTSKIITQSELKSLLDYDPETGIFVWKERPVTRYHDKCFNTRCAGKRAGGKCPNGYRYINGAGLKQTTEHRLAFLYMTGEFPKLDVDHINRVRDDNRWENLREVSRSVNLHNSNSRGYYRQKDKWMAYITVEKKYRYLGHFKTELAAAYAYHVAKVSLLESSEQRP